jgi:uncharacterized membrane protein HdeD (DUF308 family)
MDYRVKQLMKGKLVPAVLSIVLGIVIIIARRAAVDVLVKVTGGLIVAAGIGFFVAYMTRKDKSAGNLKMVAMCSLVMVAVGVLLFVFAANVVDIFPIIMGVYLILNGLSHLTEGYVDPDNRVIASMMAIVLIALGVLIVLQPNFLVNTIMIFIGAAFVVSGISDILLVIRVNGGLI